MHIALHHAQHALQSVLLLALGPELEVGLHQLRVLPADIFRDGTVQLFPDAVRVEVVHPEVDQADGEVAWSEKVKEMI